MKNNKIREKIDRELSGITLSDRHAHDRADPYDPEDSFQAFHSLFIIIFALTVYIDSAVAFMNEKGPVHTAQCKPDLTHKGVLKHITVLPFDPYLSVLDQK